MNRWVRFAGEEILRTGALATLTLGCIFITVPFVMETIFSRHVFAWGLVLLHGVLLITWMIHAVLFQAHHGWMVLRGRAKGMLTAKRLSWSWQVGYGFAMALCIAGEWWWTRAQHEMRAASQPGSWAENSWSNAQMT